ncbi:MAG: YdbH domain-containing protein [Lentisphaeria bacterium]|nr:YdbH domain-containing protein [Lentisphaeria bacterium]
MSFRQSIASSLSNGWRFLRRHVATLCWLAVTLSLLAALALVTLLPGAVEKVVNNLAARLSADGAIEVTVTRIGLFGSDLSCRSNGDAHGVPDGIERYLNIPSIRINYRPLQLLRGQLSSIDIDGAQAAVFVKDGQVELPLLRLLKRDATPEAAPAPAPSFDLPAFYASLPVRVDTIRIDGDIMVCTPHEIIPVACQLRLQPPPAADGPVIDFQVKLHHSRNTLRSTGRMVIDAARVYASAQWQADSEAMPLSLRRLLPAQCQASFSGQADIVFALASMDLQVFIAAFACKANLSQQQAEIKGNAAVGLNVRTRVLSALDARLEGIIDLSEQSLRLHCQPVVTAKLQADQQLALSITGINADIAGTKLAINRIDASCDSAGKAAQGSMHATVNDQSLPNLAFAITRDQDAVAIDLSSASAAAPAPPLSMQIAGYDIKLSAPAISAQAQLNDGGHCQLSLSCQDLRVAHDEFRAAMSANSVAIHAEAQLSDSIDYQLAMECGDLTLTRDDIQAGMSTANVDISGSGNDATARVLLGALSAQCPPGVQAAIGACSVELSANGPDVQAVVRVNDGRVAMPERDFSAQFTLEWPLLWPPPASAAPVGVFHISDCRLGQEALGAMEGTATLSQAGLAIAADASLRGLTASLKADLAPFPAADVALRAAFTLPEQPLPQGILPVSLVPQLVDFSIAGRVAGDATFSMAGGKQQGKAAFSFSNGVVSNPKQKLAVSGLKLSFALADLPALRSGGNQQASFQELSVGKIAISNGRLRFGMERPDSWLVENLSFKWCDGRIRLDSTRFSPETKRPRLTLTCDRVKLGALLEQLGVGQDQGEGRISGTIPVVLTEHGPRFRDAFLYSTPGETGMIRLRPAGTLSAMAAASDQLSLALDALSDYSYSWVRLSLDSDKDMLKLKLETDGKPTQPLYYAPKDGSIVRSAVASIFQGLQLNANFNIPLEKSTELFQNFNQLFKQQ